MHYLVGGKASRFVIEGGPMEAAQLSDEVISKLSDEQLTVLQDLGELAAKKLKLASLIEQYTQQVTASQKTMGFQTKDDPTGLHEDPEVLSLVTIKERYKITNISEQIRRTLHRAVDVGLGHLAIVQRQCQVYGVECTTNPEADRRYFSDLQKPSATPS
jgi:hypothetical protein